MGRAKARQLAGPALCVLAAVLAFVPPLAAWALFIAVPLCYVLPRTEKPATGRILSWVSRSQPERRGSEL